MSACNTSDCNVFQKGPSDQQVTYTGSQVILGTNTVCTGSSLLEVENIVLQTLKNYSTGVGISIPGIHLTTGACATLFSSCIACCGTCTDLPCLLECYHTAFCTLYTDVTLLQTEIGALLGPYNTACLSNGITTNSTIAAIIQEIILELCKAETDITNLQTAVGLINTNLNINIGNFLATAIFSNQNNSGLTGPNIIKTGSGATTKLEFRGFSPVGSLLPFVGPLTSRFDGSNNGIINTDCWGWVLCDGLSHTVNGVTITAQNMTGQAPVGLSTMGSLPSNATGLTLTAVGQNLGEVNHTLLTAEVPSSPIGGSLTDPGHDHAFQFATHGYPTNNSTSQGVSTYDTSGGTVTQGGGIPPVPTNTGGVASPLTPTVLKSQTGISLSGASVSGGNGSHNNLQPSNGVYYIQRIF